MKRILFVEYLESIINTSFYSIVYFNIYCHIFMSCPMLKIRNLNNLHVYKNPVALFFYVTCQSGLVN